MQEIKDHDGFTTIYRDDGKIILASPAVYDHIGTHASPGKGSVFSGGITQEMINEFLSSADIPDSGGGIPANFSGGGYLLVAPYDVAMQLRDATVSEGSKEDFDQKTKAMVPIPITEVHTSQPIEDFATDVTTVLVFPYDPSRSTPEQNKFVDGNSELTSALNSKKLYALATAFPGGFELDEVAGIKFPKQKVPRATEWGGTTNPTWAVIIPGNHSNGMMESWNRLAGLS